MSSIISTQELVKQLFILHLTCYSFQDSESEVDDFDGNSSGSSLPVYPPAGVVLENMTTYLLENKSIPVDIPQEFLQEHMNIAELHPEKTNCQFCPSHTGKQRLKYGTVALTVSLRSGSSLYFDEFLTFWIITRQAFIVRH